MKLLVGRNFESGVPNHDMVIINEEAVIDSDFQVRKRPWDQKSLLFPMEGEPSTIIGVLANYYQQSPKEQQIPLLLRYEDNADYFSIRLNTENMAKTLAEVKETWNQVFPNTLFPLFLPGRKVRSTVSGRHSSSGK